MRKLERESLLADRGSVLKLLDQIPSGDVLGRASFKSRLSKIDEALAKVDERVETQGSVALIFGGEPVQGARAIDSKFASEILSGFGSLVSKKVAFDEMGSLGARGPLPGRTEVNLSITELVRGSVGFLLEEQARNDTLADTSVKAAIDEVTELIAKTGAESGDQFEGAMETLDPRLLGSLRIFFRTLDDHQATVRIVEDSREANLDAASVHRGRERIDTTEIDVEEDDALIVDLIGLLPASRQFEMRLAGSTEVIKGSVAAAYASSYLELIESPHEELIGHRWQTKMRIREIKERNKEPRTLYTLIGLVKRLD